MCRKFLLRRSYRLEGLLTASSGGKKEKAFFYAKPPHARQLSQGVRLENPPKMEDYFERSAKKKGIEANLKEPRGDRLPAKKEPAKKKAAIFLRQ